MYGIQFHPESILTEMGMRILENFLTDVAGIDIENRKKEIDMTTMNQETLKPFLAKIVEGNHLTTEESYKAMDCIMSGNATEAQIAVSYRTSHEWRNAGRNYRFCKGNACQGKQLFRRKQKPLIS